MLRPYRARGVLLASLLLAAGCQDYNFNPVGHCVIQPGTRRVTLSNVSTADVLFVVDESGSMGGEQAALASNFDAFISNLDQANVDRAAAGLDPIDFHLAVTTSSVFWNEVTSNTCRTDCQGAAGQPVCCMTTGAPVRMPRKCASATGTCPVAGTSCRLDCATLQGEYYCCNADGSVPPAVRTEVVPCAASRVGTACGSNERHYRFQGCASNVSANEWPYPQGDFVSNITGATPNPRVLHFDKELYRNGANLQGYTSAQLVDWFRQNVQVGTCGSGEEQALQAGRLAIQKAFASEQKDTRNAAGGDAWTRPTGTQPVGSAPARWPNPNSKIVLVFVGDEDDCSSPQDPAGGVVMLPESSTCAVPGTCDACQRDALESTPAALRNKQYPVEEFVSYFTSLGRPVAAGFILPAAQNSCTLASCTAGICCGASGCSEVNGAQAPGTRLLATATRLAQSGVDVVAGSICDPNFGTILDEIADIVKPPSGLELPTLPAEDDVTLLRIGTPGGQTRKLCSRPAPTGLSLAQAQDAIDPATGQRYDWWFTVDGNPGGSVTVSQFVYINPKGACIANPGETYSADYIGRLPAGGCRSDAQCQATLGGEAGSWTCFAGVSGAGVCLDPATSPQPGTCLCGQRSNNCPNG